MMEQCTKDDIQLDDYDYTDYAVARSDDCYFAQLAAIIAMEGLYYYVECDDRLSREDILREYGTQTVKFKEVFPSYIEEIAGGDDILEMAITALCDLMSGISGRFYHEYLPEDLNAGDIHDAIAKSL